MHLVLSFISKNNKKMDVSIDCLQIILKQLDVIDIIRLSMINKKTTNGDIKEILQKQNNAPFLESNLHDFYNVRLKNVNNEIFKLTKINVNISFNNGFDYLFANIDTSNKNI